MAHDSSHGSSNVVRFPIEERERPTLDLLRELAPDVREVERTAEAFQLAVPDPGFRHRIDEEAAEYILTHIDPAPGETRTAALRALRDRAVVAAVKAARAWRRATTEADDARRLVVRGRAVGGYWLDALEQRRERLEQEAAVWLLEAHMRTEEAEGVARAVRLALSGETWTPYNHHRETDALFFAAERYSA